MGMNSRIAVKRVVAKIERSIRLIEKYNVISLTNSQK
jgi:hypothetical protein